MNSARAFGAQLQNAGVPAVAVSYGAHLSDELERMNPIGCVDSFEQLLQWLKKNG